jgi:hypothetical protein
MSWQRFIRVRSPAGHDLGWISPALIVSINPTGRYIKFMDGARLVDATVDNDEARRVFGIDAD